VLAVGGGVVVEFEGVGDEGGGDLEDELVQQLVEGGGDGAGRVAEPEPGLAVLVAGEIAGRQPQDAGERLGVGQQQARGGARPDRGGGGSGEAALLGDGRAG
jgi:hypothetical protein